MSIEKYETDLREMIEIQGRKGTIDQGDYMVGMYNGMVFALSLITGKDPEYKDCDKERKPDPTSILREALEKLAADKGAWDGECNSIPAFFVNNIARAALGKEGG